MSPNDPLFLSEIHTWCPRCGTQHAAAAGELSEQPEIACRRCHYEFVVDPQDLKLEIAARRVADAAKRRLAEQSPRASRDRQWQHYLYASRGQRPLYPIEPAKLAE